MKMSKNYKRLCFVLGLSTVIGTGTLAAKSGTETKQATYRNIQVTYNGTAQSLSLEPFLIDGSVYVPLRAFGDIVGVNATWAPASNTVLLTGGSSNSTSQAEIAQLTYQNTLLQRQLEEANAKLSKYESGSSNNGSSTTSGTTTGTNITAAQLRETEKYLDSMFSDSLSSKIDFDFNLSQTASRLDLTISYSTKAENKVFNETSQRNIQKFIEKVCDNIAATHKDIEIKGIIEYSNANEEKVSFTRSKAAKYSYNFAFDVKELTNLIEDETNGSITLDKIGKITISDSDVTIREAKTTINAKLYLATSDQNVKDWSDFSITQKRSAVRGQLEDIQGVLFDRTNYDVNVIIYDHTGKLMAEINSDGNLSYN